MRFFYVPKIASGYVIQFLHGVRQQGFSHFAQLDLANSHAINRAHITNGAATGDLEFFPAPAVIAAVQNCWQDYRTLSRIKNRL